MKINTKWRVLVPRALVVALAVVALSGCGTLTGLPAHGGGKRFATEQRLVSASIRSALMDIDVTALKGKRAALIFDLVADEGGGSFNGGRWSPGLLFSVGSMASPVTTTTNAFQVYNLADAGSNYNNSSSGGGSTSTSTTLQNGSNTNTGTSSTEGSSTNTSASTGTNSSSSSGSNTNTSDTTGSSTNTSSGTNSGTSTTTGSNTDTSTTTNNGTSSGSSTSTTGGTTTNTSFNQTDGSTNATTGSGTNTSTTTNSGTNTSTGSGTNTSNTTGSGTNTSTASGSNTSDSTGSGTNTSASNSSNNGTNASNAVTTTTSRNNGTNRNQGGYSSQRETLTPSPSETVTQTKGTHRDATATLQYKGLGEYQNFPVPKSDASLLMGLVRNYMLLNGVTPTTPNDPTAEALVYITVDIFGTVRSRFDAILYNNETVKAETSFEIMAFDREGRNILKPQVSNAEAQYREHYLLWAGPLTTNERVYEGQGLLVDFSKVDGSKATYNAQAPVEREFLGGKN